MPNSTLLQLMGLPRDEDDISYDICLDLSKASWGKVTTRIATHPNEAMEEDCLHGNSPLEIILKSKSREEIPLGVYKNILKSNEEQEQQEPLNEGIFIYVLRKHWYSEEYMSELVSLLLDHIKGVDGRRLIEMCIWYCNIAAAKVVLQRHPGCIFERDSIKGQLPLHVACEENNESELGKSKLIELLLLEGVKHNVGGLFGAGGLYVRDNRGNTPLMQLLQCMNNPFAWDSRLLTLCIRVAFEASQSQMMEGLQEIDESHHDEEPDASLYFPILHEAMNISSPDVFYRIIEIVKEYDIELSGTDRRGRTALIKAIYMDSEEQQRASGGVSSTTATKPKYTRKTSTKEIIGMVVGAVQSNCAKIRDGAGRLPLHIATEMGLKWDEGIRDIVFANRNGLKERHCVTGLYSFMIAATVPNGDLDTIFSLMRERPGLVIKRNAAAPTDNDGSDSELPLIGSVFSFHKPPVHGPLVPNATWDTAPDEDSPSAKTMSTFHSLDSTEAPLLSCE